MLEEITSGNSSVRRRRRRVKRYDQTGPAGLGAQYVPVRRRLGPAGGGARHHDLALPVLLAERPSHRGSARPPPRGRDASVAPGRRRDSRRRPRRPRHRQRRQDPDRLPVHRRLTGRSRSAQTSDAVGGRARRERRCPRQAVVFAGVIVDPRKRHRAPPRQQAGARRDAWRHHSAASLVGVVRLQMRRPVISWGTIRIQWCLSPRVQYRSGSWATRRMPSGSSTSAARPLTSTLWSRRLGRCRRPGSRPRDCGSAPAACCRRRFGTRSCRGPRRGSPGKSRGRCR